MKLLFLMILQAFEIMHFISRLKWAVKHGYIIVLDYDGTMVRFYYGVNAMLPCLDKDVYEYSKTHNLYANVYTFKIVQYILSKLPSDKIYVLTRSEVTLREFKNNAIMDKFNIAKDHIFHVQESSEKVEVLRNLAETLNTKIIFIEDNHGAGLAAEESLRGTVYSYLIASLFV